MKPKHPEMLKGNFYAGGLICADNFTVLAFQESNIYKKGEPVF